MRKSTYVQCYIPELNVTDCVTNVTSKTVGYELFTVENNSDFVTKTHEENAEEKSCMHTLSFLY